MSIIIDSDSIAARLSAASAPSDLCSPDGKVYGQFIPAGKNGRTTYPEFGMSDEELDARANRPDAKWYTPDEVMVRLRGLTKES